MSLSNLCQVTRQACDILAPLISTLYSTNSFQAIHKSDSSVFTIADGLVQALLTEHLLGNNQPISQSTPFTQSQVKFKAIVGEEESNVNIFTKPYKVDNLLIPEQHYDLIDTIRESITTLGNTLDYTSYKDLTVFIDPIDGTREFSTGKGEQCSICVGFADSTGKPVAGVVYRKMIRLFNKLVCVLSYIYHYSVHYTIIAGPLTDPPTWAAGALSESYKENHLDHQHPPKTDGFLTSNGSISPFTTSLMAGLSYVRVPSGGAGNKALMLLEGKGDVYIQDRGVSRWDTCAAQAVLEAHGGSLTQLAHFLLDQSLLSYTYLQSETNLDFRPGTAALTKFNVRDKTTLADRPAVEGEEVYAQDATEVKAYANLNGLLALSPPLSTTSPLNLEDRLSVVYEAAVRASAVSPPSFD